MPTIGFFSKKSFWQAEKERPTERLNNKSDLNFMTVVVFGQ
jgi:hypothetical protein